MTSADIRETVRERYAAAARGAIAQTGGCCGSSPTSTCCGTTDVDHNFETTLYAGEDTDAPPSSP